jgi:hypothetical protein
LYRYFMNQSTEFCCHNPLCCFLTSVYCCKHIFRYRLSPEIFGYSLVCYKSNFTKNISDIRQLMSSSRNCTYPMIALCKDTYVLRYPGSVIVASSPIPGKFCSLCYPKNGDRGQDILAFTLYDDPFEKPTQLMYTSVRIRIYRSGNVKYN